MMEIEWIKAFQYACLVYRHCERLKSSATLYKYQFINASAELLLHYPKIDACVTP